MKNIKGFTLSEVMVTLGVLGVLAAVIIPAVMSVRPDTERVMFKKAYSTIEKSVSDLINNETYYPTDVTGTTTDTSLLVPAGFNNQTTTGTGVPASTDKFCYLLSQNLNTVGTVDCATASGANKTFTTSDGMIWKVDTTTFVLHSSTYAGVNAVSVDVNGNKTPNCFYDADTCAEPDQFKFRIRYDGKISVDSSDPVAVDMLTNPTENR